MKIDLNKLKRRITTAVTGIYVSLLMPFAVFAEETQSVVIRDNLNVQDVVGKLLNWLLLAGQLAGGGVLIYAFITFGLSIAQENPDQRSRAILFIIAGAFLVSIKYVLNAIGVIDLPQAG